MLVLTWNKEPNVDNLSTVLGAIREEHNIRNVRASVVVQCGIAGIFNVDSVLLASVDLFTTSPDYWDDAILSAYVNAESSVLV